MVPSLSTLMTSGRTGLGHPLNSAHAVSELLQHPIVQTFLVHSSVRRVFYPEVTCAYV